MDESIFFDKQGETDTFHRHLPHWNQTGKLQFLTFHLSDSLPQSVLEKFRLEKEKWILMHPLPWSEEDEKYYHKTFVNRIDKWLDSGHGNCILRNEKIADVVEDVLSYDNDKRYSLISYVIMPNHVHLLVLIYEEEKLSDLLQEWKSISAHKINKILGRHGSLWMPESFDRLIRDGRHFYNVLEYILKNQRTGGVRYRIFIE